MSFNLGLIAGFGRAQREVNMREHDENLSAEKTKNDATAALLHDFMLRDDVTPEVRQAAIGSLMQFSQQPGLPTAKHRQQAMDGLLGAFNTQRAYTPPSSGNDGNAAEPRAGANGIAMLPGNNAALSPESRTGFLRPDEIATRQGNAFGLQTRAYESALGPQISGSGESDYELVRTPDGKGGMTTRVIPKTHRQSQARYLDGDGDVQVGFINIDRMGHAVDGFGRPVQVLDAVGRDNYATMTGVDPATGQPTKTRGLSSDFASAGPQQQFVRKLPVRGDTLTGEEMLTAFDPVTGTVSPRRTVIGQRPNIDINRAKAGVELQSKQQDLDIKGRTFAINYDPDYTPPGIASASAPGTPVGQPIVNGKVTGLKQYGATKEPAAILARASAARSVKEQVETVARTVEDPKNADLMGKVAGRVNEFLVDGPQAYGLKWIGPIGTNDPRLAKLWVDIKSVSDLLTTVHGRRSDTSAENFARTMRMVDSPQALAAALRGFQKIAENINAQGQQTTTPTTTIPTRNAAAPGAPAAPAAPAHKVGDRVIYKGKHTVIKAVYPDGTYEVQ